MDFLRTLFDTIVDSVFPPRDTERVVRALSQSDVDARVDPQIVERTKPATIAFARFQDPAVRALVHEAKYRGNTKAQRLLGGMLARYLADWGADKDAPSIIVPVPLSPARRAERGYNQCEEIARYALAAIPESGAHGFTLDTALVARVRNTEHQTRLTRLLRRQNLAGAFKATRPADPGALYIVFDDVLTTGATLQAAIDAVKEAGTQNVIPVALAH